jgi:hypothetical protein
MRVRLSRLIALLLLPALTAPAWAKDQTADIRLNTPATIEGISLQPGKYHIVVYEEGTEVKFTREGKIVAYVKANWIRLDRKAEHSGVLLSGDAVDEVDYFSSKRRRGSGDEYATGKRGWRTAFKPRSLKTNGLLTTRRLTCRGNSPLQRDYCGRT